MRNNETMMSSLSSVEMQGSHTDVSQGCLGLEYNPSYLPAWFYTERLNQQWLRAVTMRSFSSQSFIWKAVPSHRSKHPPYQACHGKGCCPAPHLLSFLSLVASLRLQPFPPTSCQNMLHTHSPASDAHGHGLVTPAQSVSGTACSVQGWEHAWQTVCLTLYAEAVQCLDTPQSPWEL